MKIGFTIAVYDKYEEVEVCADIIKSNFTKFESVICVGSNNPKARERFANNKLIDYIADGEDLKQEKHTSQQRVGLSHGDIAVSVMRTASNTFAAVNKLLETDVDYIVTLHSDAWVLNEDKLLRLIELMEQKHKPFAFRDLNFYYTSFNAGSLTPYLIDFFMIMKKDFIKENNIFKHDSFSLFPGFINNIHNIFYYLIAVQIRWENALCYSTYHNFQFWDGTPVYYNKYLAPYAYDPKCDQVHINVGSFFDKLGESLQAQILKKYNFKGEYIQSFLDKHLLDDKILLGKLKEYDEFYAKKLKRIGMNFLLYGLSRSHAYIDKALKKKLGILKLIQKAVTARLRIKRNTKSYMQLINENINEQDLTNNGHYLWHREIFLSEQDKSFLEKGSK